MIPGKILLVDDDQSILAVLKYRLELQGYQVITAQNGNAAERQVADEHPDLVLLDVMMPGQDGVATCAHLLHDNVTPPTVVMLSAVSDSHMVEAAYAAGASGFINKPFNFGNLLAQVDHYLTNLPNLPIGDRRMPPKVLIADQLDPRAATLLTEAGFQADTRLKLLVDELKRSLREDGYAAILVRSDTKLTREVLAEARGLKLIVRAGVGLDNVDAEAAKAQGIAVMNTPAATTISVAELVSGMMLTLARRLNAADRSVREGKWERKAFQGIELHGKTLAVLGLGRIGSQVASIARALGMTTIAYDPIVTVEQMAAQDVQAVSLEAAVQQADVLTLHLPLTDETRNLLDHARLSTMKPTAFIINAARGGVLDEAALAELLLAGKLGGVALDVYATEPPGADNPLLKLANEQPQLNLLFTPHIGASTSEGQAAAGVNAAELVRDYFKEQAA